SAITLCLTDKRVSEITQHYQWAHLPENRAKTSPFFPCASPRGSRNKTRDCPQPSSFQTSMLRPFIPPWLTVTPRPSSLLAHIVARKRRDGVSMIPICRDTPSPRQHLLVQP